MMDKKSYDLEKLFHFPEQIEYKPLNCSFRDSLTRILEALYIQKLKETNSDFLSQLSFNQILNLPSLVSECIFNALISEPREYIKLEEFVEGLGFLFDKNIDFQFNEKTNVPKIYEILYRIFCLKKTKQQKNNTNSNNDINSIIGSSKNDINNLSKNKNNLSSYSFNYQFDLEYFNKLISNVLLVYYINANNFKTEEFLPFCEEIKLIVKKTFTFNYNKNSNNHINNFSYNSNINLNVTSNYNNVFPHIYANQNNLNLNSLNEKEEEFSCRSFNINLNLNNNVNCDTNMNLNMNMQNNLKMNLNLNMNINDISTISENLNKTKIQCSQCKLCMNCSKLNSTSNNNFNTFNNNLNFSNNENFNSQKNFISLEDFVESLQKNSKLLFILLFLFYSLSPINQKLIYLLMKNPYSKIIEDEGEGDFIEEDEKAEEIQSIPDSVKKINLEEIKFNSRIMSENNSINNSFDGVSYPNNNNNNNKLGFEKKTSTRSVDSNISKFSNTNLLLGNKGINDFKENVEKDFQESNNANKKLNYLNNKKQSPSKAEIVFDFSEDTDSFSNLNSGNNTNNNLNNPYTNKNGSLNQSSSNYFSKSDSITYNNASKTNSYNGSSGTLNILDNKSKFFNTKSLFERNNSNANNNISESDNNIIYSVKPEEIQENIEVEKSRVTNNNYTITNNKNNSINTFYYKINQNDSLLKKNVSYDSHKNSHFSGNSDGNSNQKSKFFTSTNINLNNYLSSELNYNDSFENKNNQKLNFNENKKNIKSNIHVNKNVINFNLDDDSSSFITINNKNNNISEQNNRNKLNINNYTNTQRSDNNNIKLISYDVKAENSESDIIVYRNDKTNESSEYTDNNNIFNSKFRRSFDNIIISSREENNSNINNNKSSNKTNSNNNHNFTKHYSSEISRSNTKNSLYNDFNELLSFNNKNNNHDKNNKNNKNSNSENRSLSLNFRNGNRNEGISQIKSVKTITENRNLNTFNSLLNNCNHNLNKALNGQFAFEEVFSELKVSVQKVKISKDFIFDAKKCEKFAYHSKHNKNFSFKNFNFYIENDWVIRSLKNIYIKITDNRVSEIKNFNKHLSFLTVFYQFNSVEKTNNNKKAIKIILGNSSNNVNKINNVDSEDDFLIKEKSKNLAKFIADVIDEYLVIFSFKNAFEANLIHNFISNNKEKIKEGLVNKNENAFSQKALSNKNLEPRMINPSNKNSSNKTSNACTNFNKETIFGFSDKITNFKYTTKKNNYNDVDSKEFLSSNNINNNNKNNLENKHFNNFEYKQNIDFINHSEEMNSEVFSVMDIYESNDFFSVNVKLIINLRNSELFLLSPLTIRESKFYPLKIKQEENIHLFFFETEIEREILVNYFKEKIKNVNPIKNYDLLDVISKTKCLEFTKGAHKVSKASVEIKKYFKKNLKTEKMFKEINCLRDLSMVYKFFEDSKIPKILFFENSEEMCFVYENYEDDPINFIFMNPDLKVSKDISKYSVNIQKMKELKNMLEILSISLSPDYSSEI